MKKPKLELLVAYEDKPETPVMDGADYPDFALRATGLSDTDLCGVSRVFNMAFANSLSESAEETGRSDFCAESSAITLQSLFNMASESGIMARVAFLLSSNGGDARIVTFWETFLGNLSPSITSTAYVPDRAGSAAGFLTAMCNKVVATRHMTLHLHTAVSEAIDPVLIVDDAGEPYGMALFSRYFLVPEQEEWQNRIRNALTSLTSESDAQRLIAELERGERGPRWEVVLDAQHVASRSEKVTIHQQPYQLRRAFKADSAMFHGASGPDQSYRDEVVTGFWARKVKK